MIARTLFGAFDFSYYRSNALFTEPFNSITVSEEQSQAITAHISVDPTLSNIFEPLHALYYDGPMGGYGINLKSRFVGYHTASAEGLHRVLELRQINVPLIRTPNDFRHFIQQTPMMTRAIAIVVHHEVIGKQAYDDREMFYTIIYEKRENSDVLYIYSSQCIDIEFLFKNTQHYFRSKFFLFTPDQIRESTGISDLFSIQDAKYLMSVLKIEINAPMLLKGQTHQFHLSEAFSYNENSLIQDHVTTMLKALLPSNDPEPLDETSCRIS